MAHIPGVHHSCPDPFAPLDPERGLAPSPFKIDEGFSEDTRSGNASPEPDSLAVEATAGISAQITSARQWLLAQHVELRSEIARELLLSLPNAVVSDIVRDANDRLHFDPILCLPEEIILEIFEYLGASALLSASIVSKAWRDRAFEPRLWRRLFTSEGWTHNQQNMRSFENNSRLQIAGMWSNTKIRPRPGDWTPERSELKKARLDDLDDPADKAVRLWVERGSLGLPPGLSSDDPPDDVSSKSNKQQNLDSTQAKAGEDMQATLNVPARPDFSIKERGPGSFHGRISQQTICPLLRPSHLIDTMSESPRPNWQWIYKQRRRLEHNWNTGRFTNFRFPHPDHPSEGHSQCIYTLQFSSKYVVSGSRDKSIRVWDFDTRRLKVPPLLGHFGSVLCLQFDERPEHDLIVSGGSDSDVIIWQLSTGAMIRRLRRAHSESVLNLRFDDRYLVTCSKDKTIKLWNRKILRPTDPDYAFKTQTTDAKYPDYIINLKDSLDNPRLGMVEPLPPYSLLLTFEGHNAAVNAIQVFENHVVSASGDRKIILWDIQTGSLVRQFGGHSKGIACVQYDGRRIVSGSSDNTVRIFDSATAAEVATLEGHRNLVRTVQAEFGDMLDAEYTLEAEARENDRRLVNDRSSIEPHVQTLSKRHFVFGAKLPPGGGGNRWSKIVSGSYDETVMIWRRDKEGEWKVTRELRQEDAIRASATTMNPPSRDTRSVHSTNQPMPQAHLAGPSFPTPTGDSTTAAPSALSDAHAQPPAAQSGLSAGMRASLHYQQRLRQRHLEQHQLRAANGILTAGGALQSSQVPASTQPPTVTPGELLEPESRSPPPQVAHPVGSPHSPAHLNPQNPYFWYRPPTNFPAAPRNAAAPPQTAARADAETREEATVSRLFKLQFDARRIMSSSQLPVIVGWDFANGDRDIIEASQFFGEPI